MFIDTDSVTFGWKLPLKQFSQLLATHHNLNPETQNIESQAQTLIEQDFPEDSTGQFVNAVCAWGGYAGVAGRVLQNNERASVCATFRECWQMMQAFEQPGLVLTRMNRLYGLGTPSFASKHLRFLSPEYFPVFDSVIREAMPYPFTPNGYTAFTLDCRELAAYLNTAVQLCQHSHRQTGRWYAADVESAIFVARRANP